MGLINLTEFKISPFMKIKMKIKWGNNAGLNLAVAEWWWEVQWCLVESLYCCVTCCDLFAFFIFQLIFSFLSLQKLQLTENLCQSLVHLRENWEANPQTFQRGSTRKKWNWGLPRVTVWYLAMTQRNLWLHTCPGKLLFLSLKAKPWAWTKPYFIVSTAVVRITFVQVCKIDLRVDLCNSYISPKKVLSLGFITWRVVTLFLMLAFLLMFFKLHVQGIEEEF